MTSDVEAPEGEAPYVESDDGPPLAPAPRRWRDLAMLLPAFGTLLWMPPVVGLTASGGAIWGVPAIVVYLFGVWALLIALAALVAVRLGRGRG
ncbi:hypothetical protein F1188_07870 [Roseospira marina]|uniref:Uncharacterized protein n=1 Tax=Roseospira marina TaxID=140057 RepID=A0A5M6ICK2_9PROT|nr:hypothetical protein [Roseospira marina]KAA5605933.1 hypothetical protein F1188_07870 [Roseospira marina]MBB4313224.1 hypothetical protein [Roseospira marina]MBB5086035.1 hypothetical protein [Roseospira marina]